MTKRLLILDDDPAIGQTIQFIAESAGVTPRFTTEPAEFFAWLDAWQPTHIALDLIMPEMDGVEVLVQLANRRCAAKIIITSGVGHRVLDAAGRSAAEHGLDIIGVLSKPFSSVALRRLLGDIGAEAGAPALLPAVRPQRRGSPPPLEVTAELLQTALDEQQLQVVYQPKVECASGAVAGFEVLVRWVHPEYGMIMPDRFIPFAEAHGFIDALTEQVSELSLDWYARHFNGDHHDATVPPGSANTLAPSVSLSVNISARSLNDPLFFERILNICRAHGVSSSRMILELTETAAMENPTTSLDLLTRLRMKGFQLSIDDFGTGYSSMLQLVRLPFSEIKVDKSFVMQVPVSEEARTVVRSIVELGHSLGLRCTAEGVEDAQSLAYLKKVGCDLAQGYYIGRPMPGDQVLEWLRGA